MVIKYQPSHVLVSHFATLQLLLSIKHENRHEVRIAELVRAEGTHVHTRQNFFS